MDIIPNIDIHPVIVDGVAYKPVEGICLFLPFYPPEPAVTHSGKAFRYGDAEGHAVYFIVHMVLIGPPGACSQPLAGGSHKGVAPAVLFPAKTSIPGWVNGFLWMA